MSNPPFEIYLIALLSLIVGALSTLYAKRLLRGRQLGLMRKNSRLTATVDSSLNAKLSHVRNVMDADKAKIYQFQNTLIYFNFKPSKKMSLTHIQVRDGVAVPNVTALQNLPTSLMPNMMSMLLSNQGPIYWSESKAPDDFLRAKHRDEGITSTMMAGIYSSDTGNLLGFISLNWLGREAPPRDTGKLIKLAQDLGSILGH